MAIKIECANCEQHIKVKNAAWGRQVRCPKCQSAQSVDRQKTYAFVCEDGDSDSEYGECPGCAEFVLIMRGRCPLCDTHMGDEEESSSLLSEMERESITADMPAIRGPAVRAPITAPEGRESFGLSTVMDTPLPDVALLALPALWGLMLVLWPLDRWSILNTVLSWFFGLGFIAIVVLEAIWLGMGSGSSGRRETKPLVWGIGTVLFAPVVYPLYCFSRRHFGRRNLGWPALAIWLVCTIGIGRLTLYQETGGGQLSALPPDRSSSRTGETEDVVQTDLLDYLNNKLPRLASLEEEAINAFDSVTGDHYTDDQTLYTALERRVLPTYATFIDRLEEVRAATPEIRGLHNKYVEAANIQRSAFLLMMSGLERQDAALVTQATEKLAQARAGIRAWQDDLAAIAKAHRITLPNQPHAGTDESSTPAAPPTKLASSEQAPTELLDYVNKEIPRMARLEREAMKAVTAMQQRIAQFRGDDAGSMKAAKEDLRMKVIPAYKRLEDSVLRLHPKDEGLAEGHRCFLKAAQELGVRYHAIASVLDANASMDAALEQFGRLYGPDYKEEEVLRLIAQWREAILKMAHAQGLTVEIPLLAFEEQAIADAKSAVCLSRLKLIGTALYVYASENRDDFPPNLAILVSSGSLSRDSLESPFAAAGSEQRFTYIADLSAYCDPECIVAYGEEIHIRNQTGRFVLFVDAHADFLESDAFEKALRKTREVLAQRKGASHTR